MVEAFICGHVRTRLGLSPADCDVIESNEAFAAQALATLRDLGLPEDAMQVNSNGGAGVEAPRRQAGTGDHLHRCGAGDCFGIEGGLSGPHERSPGSGQEPDGSR